MTEITGTEVTVDLPPLDVQAGAGEWGSWPAVLPIWALTQVELTRRYHDEAAIQRDEARFQRIVAARLVEVAPLVDAGNLLAGTTWDFEALVELTDGTTRTWWAWPDDVEWWPATVRRLPLA